MKLGIGIDTGGTCTDAVLCDLETNAVLASAKALTTREDLSRGILAALDALPADLVRRAERIALSTTLATNACVEDKLGRARLILLGGSKTVLARHGAAYGLPEGDGVLVLEQPDWDAFRAAVSGPEWDALDGVGIVELGAMASGAAAEKQARELFAALHPTVRVICAHELFSDLNSLQRGAGTLLNAALFPVIEEFLTAFRRAMQARGLSAATVIVRSDGSLMDQSFASLRPVETLLCGPAASVLGGCALSGEEDCVVVDMGGTTTDLALVRGGAPVTVTGGVHIGRWRTFVNGLSVRTFGLGGDTAIRYDEGRLMLEEGRIVPLCVAAARYPGMLVSLRETEDGKTIHSKPLYQHLLLSRAPEEDGRWSPEELALCSALAQGPLSLRRAAAAVGRDIYTLPLKNLLRGGVVQVCGLTPTDIMHLRGDYDAYDREAALLGARFVARNLGCTVEDLCARVYDAVEKKLYRNIVLFLMEHRLGRTPGEDTEKLIDDCYALAKAGKTDPCISLSLCTPMALLGIGAPTHIFLPRVAELLGTRAVIPPHSEVANALGAVAGGVSAAVRVEVRPVSAVEGPCTYTVFTGDAPIAFDDLEQAEAAAERDARIRAEEEARRRGARGAVTVTCRLERREVPSGGHTVYLGSTALAEARGNFAF